MKKLLVFLCVFVMVLFIAGCGSGQNQPTTNMQSQQQAKPAEPPAEVKPANTDTKAPIKEESPVCKVAGIGDTLNLFEKAYGKVSIKNDNHTFQNDKIVVLPLNNRAYNITVSTNKKDKAQSWEELLGFLPIDMQIIKESKKDDGMVIKFITLGVSKKLAEVSPQSDGGKFLVIQNFDKKTNANIGNVIGLGHNP